MHRLPAFVCLAAILWRPAAPHAAHTRLAPSDSDDLTAKRISQVLPREHLTHYQLDDSIAAKAWTNYLAALDYERVMFTEKDIAEFRRSEAGLADALRKGNLDFAYRAFEVFLGRLSNRCAYVSALLDKGFDVTQDETYVWKRKDAPWPADENEWNELWRKKVKNDYVQRLVAMSRKEPPAQATTNGPAQTNAEAGGSRTAEDRDALLSPKDFIRKRYDQLQTVLTDSDSEWVLQRFLTAFAQAYDPHSGYMSPATAEDFDIEMKLSLVGIGALLRSEDGAAMIERIIPGGPADRDRRDKRLRPGDKIIAVAQDEDDSVNILHWPLHKVVRLIRGEKGTRVVLTVIPASDLGGVTKTVDLIRDEVRLEEQEAKSKLQEVTGRDGTRLKLAILTLPAFYANLKATSASAADYKSAADDVRELLEDLKESGAEGLLLDLRNNGGGSLLEAIKMTGLFIVTGPVVQVKERHGPIRVLPDNDPGLSYDGPLLVLVDRRSASASEIVAGALQDYGRAILVGDTKTHGKGTVQSVIEADRGRNLGSLKVTTASYYRISGGSTQMKGVAPDIVISSPFDHMEIGEEFLPNALPWSRVPIAAYAPVAQLGPVISLLKDESYQRRSADPRFKAYDQLLARVDEMSRTKELPLNLAAREKLADMEKELTDLENQIDSEPRPENGRNGRPDLVLSEALNILADYVAVQAQLPKPVVPPPESGGLLRMLDEWLKRGL